MIKLVRSTPKNYEWGSVNQLSALMGAEPSGRPEAELWFGVHPRGDCTVLADDGEVPFGQWLEASGHSLPFLVKFLAIESPLSIQVHPDEARARQGFEREELAKVPIDSPLRTFPDPLPKPELVIALSDSFELLWGFHTPQKLRDRLERWEHSGLEQGAVEQCKALFELALDEALSWIFTPSPAVGRLVVALTEWSLGDTADGAELTSVEREVFRNICSRFPGDPGIAVASLMHVVRLNRGDSLFVSPGEAHAYVRGFGLEVMSPSDNVVRGGLTPKHRDVDLFMSLTHGSPSDSAPLVRPKRGDPQHTYSPEGASFSVRGITGSTTEDLVHGGLVVIERAGVTIECGDEALRPPSGTAVFVAGPGHIVFSGEGSSWLVTRN